MKLTPARILDGVNLVYIILAAVLFLALSSSVFQGGRFEQQRREARLFYCDFAKYYVCGKIALSPDRLKAYDADVQARYLVRDALGKAGEHEEFIHYPPIDFPMMAPLSILPISRCFLAFCLLGAAIFVSSTLLLGRSAAGAGAGFSSLYSITFFWLAVFGSVPMLRAFTLGQTSLILAGVTALYAFGLLKNRPLLAGIALALTSIKPQYSVFLVVPALAQKRYKVIIFAALTELALILAAVATIGLPNIINYPQIVLHAEQTANLAGGFVAEMVNVRGLLANIMDDSIAVKIAGAIFAVAWIYLAWLWWRFAGAGRPEQKAHTLTQLLAITILYCLTFSPHTHLYDVVILSVVAPLVGQSSLRASLNGEECRMAKIFSVLLLLYPALGWVFLMMPGGSGSYHTAPFAFYNLALCLTATLALYFEGASAKTGAETELSTSKEWI